MPDLVGRIKGLLAQFGINIEEGHFINFIHTRTEQGGIRLKQKAKGNITNIIVADPAVAKALIKAEQVEEVVEKTTKTIGFFTRKDLAGYDLLALGSQGENEETMRILGDVITRDDLVALSIAMTIKKYEVHSNAEEALKLRRDLVKRFGERGNRIYVFYATSMFQTIMDDVISLLKIWRTATDKLNAKELWDACLDHMDYAIYVNREMLPWDIVLGLIERFHVNRVRSVLVFGRTEDIISKVDKAIQHFIALEKERVVDALEFSVERSDFVVGETTNAVFLVSVK